MAEDRGHSEGASRNGRNGRFPSLARLRLAGGRAIPYYQQTSNADCGAACLAMVLGFHGRHTRLEEVRQAAGVDRDGADALRLLEAARSYGLRARGLKVESVEDLRHLGPGTILHWRFRHFVVLERVRRRGADILDPAMGRLPVTWEQLSRSFTGIALTFEPGEGFERGGRRRLGLWRYLRHLVFRSSELGRILTLSVVLQLLALAVPMATGVVVDRILPRGDLRLLEVLAIGLGGVALFHVLCSLVRAHLLLQLRTRLDSRLTLDFLDHLVALPFSFFSTRSTGDLIMRADSNSVIREALTSGTLSAILDGALVSFSLALLVLIDVRLAGVVLALGALRVAIYLATRRRHRELMSEVLQRRASSRGYQVQILSGIETLKASGAEDRAVERWSSLFVEELNALLDQGRLDAKVESVLQSLALISPLVVLLTGGWMVLQGDLSLGTMLAGAALGVGFLQPLSTLVSKALDLQRIGSHLERIDDVLETEPEQEPGSSYRRAPISGRIEVRDVSFRYGPRAPDVVRNVRLTVEGGEMVAIVGPSGSGKSTLAGLLCGLHRPTEGRVLYDGIDLSSWDLRDLRRRLGIVTQHPFLFGATVRENIALAEPDATLDQIVEAAERAKIHDDVAAMPMGYDTVLADGGASLSGGQRQRIALARALLGRPRVLLLDEATSALDTVTERRVQEELDRLGATRIVIAHRLSTVVGAHRILVMDRGAVVAQGTHRELLEDSDLYADLVGAASSPPVDLVAGEAAGGDG